MLILFHDSSTHVDILNGGEKWEKGRRWDGFSIIFILGNKYSLEDSKNFTAKKKITLRLHFIFIVLVVRLSSE